MTKDSSSRLTDMSGSMERTRKQHQRMMLEMKMICRKMRNTIFLWEKYFATTFAPVVILVSQGPQQQGEVSTRHHMAAFSAFSSTKLDFQTMWSLNKWGISFHLYENCRPLFDLITFSWICAKFVSLHWYLNSCLSVSHANSEQRQACLLLIFTHIHFLCCEW